MARQCPRCDLRFQAETELRDHLAVDHDVVPEMLAPYAYTPGTRHADDSQVPPAVRRYLVVANQTLGGDALMEAVRERMAAGPCHFFVLVPATRAADYPVWLAAADIGDVPVEPMTDQQAMAQARERVREQVDRLRSAGCEADGEIGDPDPIEAIRSALERERIDEIILSTLPPGISRWLRRDLPSRVQRMFSPPLTVITARE